MRRGVMTCFCGLSMNRGILFWYSEFNVKLLPISITLLLLLLLILLLLLSLYIHVNSY
jgi:hypothetical protein